MNEGWTTKFHAEDDTALKVTEWGVVEEKVFFTLDIGDFGNRVTIFATPHFLSRLAETLSKYRGVEEQIALRGIVEEEREGESACP